MWRCQIAKKFLNHSFFISQTGTDIWGTFLGSPGRGVVEVIYGRYQPVFTLMYLLNKYFGAIHGLDYYPRTDPVKYLILSHRLHTMLPKIRHHISPGCWKQWSAKWSCFSLIMYIFDSNFSFAIICLNVPTVFWHQLFNAPKYTLELIHSTEYNNYIIPK